ncbi:D-glycero-beta-D-manno-heptose 1-phosphate adenylyltransferase [Nafulsella turpanensis]|uniref:D-glycero-beta-D-manno-heptose 1-phosphate adenylyltransferase n=1 Tax=Nafulsella turpanensis TaxID=1265690 RepID=UPI00037D5B05|nr:D-glycero-beta-D-manno-heptose 1-phosphate adenylyltransferase [Nafulsella turpanensis]
MYKEPTGQKIYKLPTLKNLMTKWREEGEQVVFSNGCFDILHLGHIDYLEKARQLGSKLIIGINSDASVKRLKGPERPVQPEEARCRLIAALAFVDAVVVFEEDTPLGLIETLRPHILVKGNDYAFSQIVGADFVIKNGGEVKTIPLVEGYSTTRIIEQIKKL